MDFSYSPENLEMQRTLRRFMDAEVLPRNREWQRLADSGTYPTDVVEPLKARVPMDTPGLKLVRDVPSMHHRAPEGHC